MQEINFTLTTSTPAELAGRIWLPDEPPTAAVCLVHGHGEHSGRYHHVAQALTGAGFVVLAVDLRGHGRTAGKRGGGTNYDLFMDDIQRLVNAAGQRYPGLPLFLYGHSMGGNMVLNFVLRRKPTLNGVVATAPWLRLTTPPSGGLLVAARVLYRLSPGLTLKTGLDAGLLSHDPAVVTAYQNDPLVHGMISAYLGLEMSKAGEWAIAHAAEFPLPLYLAHGDADGITSAAASRAFAKAMPAGRCTLNVYPDLYHEIHNEPQQGIVLADIVSWLQNRLSL